MWRIKNGLTPLRIQTDTWIPRGGADSHHPFITTSAQRGIRQQTRFSFRDFVRGSTWVIAHYILGTSRRFLSTTDGCVPYSQHLLGRRVRERARELNERRRMTDSVSMYVGHYRPRVTKNLKQATVDPRLAKEDGNIEFYLII